MSNLGIGIGFLSSAIITSLINYRICLILSVISPKPIILKPTLIEENETFIKKYSEQKVIYPTCYENFRKSASSDFLGFLTLLMILSSIFIIISSGVGMAHLFNS
jgi:hypothetical protein